MQYFVRFVSMFGIQQVFVFGLNLKKDIIFVDQDLRVQKVVTLILVLMKQIDFLISELKIMKTKILANDCLVNRLVQSSRSQLCKQTFFATIKAMVKFQFQFVKNILTTLIQKCKKNIQIKYHSVTVGNQAHISYVNFVFTFDMY